MFEGAHPLIFKFAKDVRKRITDAEKILWSHLKSRIMGFKFRRQHPIGGYVADFYCHKVKLVVEVDGLIHREPHTKENDKLRDQDLTKLGCHIFRVSNEEIYSNIEMVLEKLETKVDELYRAQFLTKSKNPL